MIGIGGIQNHYNFHRILFRWHNQSPCPGANDQNPQHSPPKDLVSKFLNLSRNFNDYSAKHFSRLIVGWRTLSDIVKECHHWTHPYTNKKKSFLKTLFSPCSMLLLLLEACSLATKPGWGYFFREIRWSYNGNGAKKCTKGKKVVKTIKWLFSRIFFSLLFSFEVDTPTYKAGKLSMSVQGQTKLWRKKFLLDFQDHDWIILLLHTNVELNLRKLHILHRKKGYVSK